MKPNTVPDEIYLKHENEWQALRQIAERKLDLQRTEPRSGLRIAIGERITPLTDMRAAG
jgi:hypothetical protein